MLDSVAVSITQVRALLIAIVLSAVATAAGAEPFWCEGDQTIETNPLSIPALERRISSAGIESKPNEIVNLVKTIFLARQSAISLNGDSEDQQYLDSFLNLIRENNGPEDFGFTYQKENERAFLAGLPDKTLMLPCTITLEELVSDSPTQANIALASYAIHTFGYELVTANLPVVVSAIEGISMSYRNWLLDQGLAQWPWELAINGLRIRNDPFNDPAPRSQVIFMRPSAGLEFNWGSQANANVEASVGIEPIGLIWYRGDSTSYDSWWGVSALVTLGTGDNGAGIGGLIRYNKFWIGVTDRQGTSDPFFFIGLDLHKYLRSEDGFKADIEKKLASIRSERGN